MWLLFVVLANFPRPFGGALGVPFVASKFSSRFFWTSFKTYSWSLIMNFPTRAPSVNARRAEDPLPSSKIDEEEERIPWVKNRFCVSHIQSAKAGVIFHKTTRSRSVFPVTGSRFLVGCNA